jgi:anthranilate synthase component 1
MRARSRPIVEVLPSDIDLLALHRREPRRYPHLLESVVSGPQGSHDILFGFPGPSLSLDSGGLAGRAVNRPGTRFVDALDRWAAEESADYDRLDLPFTGGWFLFLAYELVGELEPTLPVSPDPMGLPLALATRFPCALIREHRSGRVLAVCEPGQQSRLALIRADVEGLRQEPGPTDGAPPELAVVEEEAERFLSGVERIKRYIREGDVFQVNLSRLWHGRFEQGVDPLGLYDRLRDANPGPFAALVSLAGASILSSSPERLVSVRDGHIATRPIAGTRPRGPAADADLALSEELLRHPKERAEHIMLIDLERNDLGRVCRPGSIAVDELMAIESYRHVHHIVSNVRGRLRDGITPGQVIRALFPGGTITGCPKVRCMEIINELERQGRGAYTGSVGYLTRHGDMDLNILIRTLVVGGDRLAFRTGAGIVADSDALAELAETRHKAEGLLRALRA